MAPQPPPGKRTLSPRPRRRWRRGLLALVCLYLVILLLALVFHLADVLVISPSVGPLDARGARRRLLPFAGGQLEVFSARSPAAVAVAPRAYVLLFVGNEDRAEPYPAPMAADYGERPVEVWAVNYPGFGGSTGPARLNLLGPAALTAYDALAIEAAGKPIVVRGASLGSLGALCIAARRPVAGLFIQNPPPLPQLIRGKHGWWNLWLLALPVSISIPSEIDSVANARRCTAPVTFLTSDEDQVVPPAYQQLVFNAYAGPKQIIHIAGGRHASPPTAAAQLELRSADEHLWTRLLPTKFPN
jgi:pimeloyl-ACP methyl ester carboxylesterase